MRKLIFLMCLGVVFFQRMAQAACPSSIPALPTLPVPVGIPPTETCPTPTPVQVMGYLPISFINSTMLPDDEIYIVILVNSSSQYLSFSGDPKLATISDFTPTTYLSDSEYSYPLSTFDNGSSGYTLYIPNDGNTGVPSSQFMKSSRILISLKQRLTYFIDNTGLVQFPPEFDATNDNYFVLNDKIEFDLGSNKKNRLNLNLTGVDFFGLPLFVQANYKFLNGAIFTNACGKTGMPTDVTFSDVFSQYTTFLSYLSSPFDEYWESLKATYTNPASSGGALCNLRIFAPATAMSSTQKQTNPSKVSFPTNYFLSSASDPSTCTWFNAVWKGETKPGKMAFYENRKPTPYLVLDATTKDGAATAKGSEQKDGSFRFVVSGGPDAGKTVTFPNPKSSKAFFTGAIADYDPPISSNASTLTQNQLLKVFATSIIAGFFPLDCKPDQITINSSYVQSHSSQYFENNAILTKALTGTSEANSCPCIANVPWYDFYSRFLLTIGMQSLFYTSAYSDFLGTDGTIVIISLSTENSDASVTVTLGDCSTDVNFPDPYGDTNAYDITVTIPADATVEFSRFEGGPFEIIPATADGNEFFLKVTYSSGIYSGMSFVTQIAPLAQIFHPILPGQGTVTTTGSDTTVSIGASPK